MGEFSIAPNTQIGKIIVPEKVYDGENAYHQDPERYSRGGEFVENMVTDNYIEYCHRWFKLANYGEIISDIDEYFGALGYGMFSNLIDAGYGDNQYISPILPTVSQYQSPIVELTSKEYRPVVFHNKRNSELNYNNLKGNIDNE